VYSAPIFSAMAAKCSLGEPPRAYATYMTKRSVLASDQLLPPVGMVNRWMLIDLCQTN
jgi:hypothetical protein